MATLRTEILDVRSEYDVVMSRQKVRALCEELKFSVIDRTKMVTAASELARNTLIYGGGGIMRCEIVQETTRIGLRLSFEDEGPGIPDMDLAMSDGWTSGRGLGKGLPGSKRLVDDFNIESTLGKGTRVTITRWRIRPSNG